MSQAPEESLLRPGHVRNTYDGKRPPKREVILVADMKKPTKPLPKDPYELDEAP